MILTAKDAAKLSSGKTNNVCYVMLEILDSARGSVRCITLKRVSKDTRSKLRQLGYKVSAQNEYTIIKW